MKNEQKRVLVIEDDAITRGLIRTVMIPQGYSLVEAGDAAVARSIIAGDRKFDCILLDRGLPDCDGLALLHEFKRQSGLLDVPIVVQTARTDAEAIREGMAAGAFYYLPKPLDRRLLLAVVEAAIESARVAVESASLLPNVGQVTSMLIGARLQLRSLAEALELARALAMLCPEPQRAVLALQELLINAVEHGNLGITYTEKTALVLDGQWHKEIERRLRDPVLGGRWVTVDIEQSQVSIDVTIRDEGGGFDWNEYWEPSPDRAFDPNGRGIAMARLGGADYINYLGNGNTVTARWHKNAFAPATVAPELPK